MFKEVSLENPLPISEMARVIESRPQSKVSSSMGGLIGSSLQEQNINNPANRMYFIVFIALQYNTFNKEIQRKNIAKIDKKRKK